MATYIQNNSVFQPLSLQEMMAPVQYLEQQHRELEAQGAELSGLANTIAGQIDPNSEAYKQIEAYTNDVKTLAEELSNTGYNSNLRSALLQLKSRYGKEVGAVEYANKKLEVLKQQFAEAQAKDPYAIGKINPDQLSIDTVLKNPNISNEFISGSLLKEHFASAVKALSIRVLNDPEEYRKAGGNPYLLERWVERGMNPEEVYDLIQQDGSLLNLLAKDTVLSSGVTRFGDEATARAFSIIRPAAMASVGESIYQREDDKKALFDMQLAGDLKKMEMNYYYDTLRDDRRMQQELALMQYKASLSGEEKKQGGDGMSNIPIKSVEIASPSAQTPAEKEWASTMASLLGIYNLDNTDPKATKLNNAKMSSLIYMAYGDSDSAVDKVVAKFKSLADGVNDGDTLFKRNSNGVPTAKTVEELAMSTTGKKDPKQLTESELKDAQKAYDLLNDGLNSRGMKVVPGETTITDFVDDLKAYKIKGNVLVSDTFNLDSNENAKILRAAYNASPYNIVEIKRINSDGSFELGDAYKEGEGEKLDDFITKANLRLPKDNPTRFIATYNGKYYAVPIETITSNKEYLSTWASVTNDTKSYNKVEKEIVDKILDSLNKEGGAELASALGVPQKFDSDGASSSRTKKEAAREVIKAKLRKGEIPGYENIADIYAQLATNRALGLRNMLGEFYDAIVTYNVKNPEVKSE